MNIIVAYWYGSSTRRSHFAQYAPSPDGAALAASDMWSYVYDRPDRLCQCYMAGSSRSGQLFVGRSRDHDRMSFTEFYETLVSSLRAQASVALLD